MKKEERIRYATVDLAEHGSIVVEDESTAIAVRDAFPERCVIEECDAGWRIEVRPRGRRKRHLRLLR